MGELQTHQLQTPFQQEDLEKLRAGDHVLLSGTIFTARDAGHGRLMELIEKGETLPLDLTTAVIYYVGPTPEKPGFPVGSAGPTTSGRMDVYTPALLERGLKVMIGKGRRNQAVKDSAVEHGAVYLAALGGAGALMSKGIESSELIAWEDLGCEALRKFTVKDLPLTVILDAKGGDLYESGPRDYLNSL